MFSTLRRRNAVKRTGRRLSAPRKPLSEVLEDRTLLATNWALNPSGTGFPHPLESDHGWGGGAQPWEIVAGRHSVDGEWAQRLAFPGGPGHWPDGRTPAGPPQVTINFGGART